MSAEISLMQALLGPDTAPGIALAALEQALLAEADPLHWCATHLEETDAEMMRRAADWADLAFFDVIPRLGRGELAPSRLELLAEVRLYRLRLLDREVAYAAPDFFGVLRLARLRQARPSLRGELCLVPAQAMRDRLVDHSSHALIDNARQNMARYWPHAAAQLDLTTPVRWTFAVMSALLILVVLATPFSGQVWLVPLWLALVMLPALLRLLALAVPDQPRRSEREPPDWPIYSVLVPLRDEANMVDQLCTILARLDYPPEKLDIVFVVESRSPATVAAVSERLEDARFSLLVVPDAPPRTKPKALDFALPFCRGEFVVVYDAEDRPEPGQLRGVVAQFRRQPDIECIQARLVIANGGDGWLPALFAGEYAALFAILLPALARWGLVMPLGGTSNHFRLETLRRLGGWDCFNVTEDADLGVRLARRGLRCATSASVTLEDAASAFRPWLGQRVRWMKGWMQTFVVHNRKPRLLLADMGWRGAFLFEVVLIGMLLAPLLHAGFMLSLLVNLLAGNPLWPSSDVWLLTCLGAFLIGNAIAIAANLAGLVRTGQTDLLAWQCLLPVYWLLIALATILALREFTQKPFHWFKSPHRASRPAVGQGAASWAGYEAGNSFQRLGRKARRLRSPAG